MLKENDTILSSLKFTIFKSILQAIFLIFNFKLTLSNWTQCEYIC